MRFTLTKSPLFRLVVLTVITAGLLFYIHPVTVEAKAGAQMIPVNFSDLATQARPGVVNISTVKSVKDGGRVFEHFLANLSANAIRTDGIRLKSSSGARCPMTPTTILNAAAWDPVLSSIQPD